MRKFTALLLCVVSLCLVSSAESDSDNSDEDEQCKSPTFFGKLYDKIKAEYFDKSNSRDGSPRKSDAGNLFSLNRVNKSETKKVRNPSQKSIKTEKRVSFIGDSWATLDKN